MQAKRAAVVDGYITHEAQAADAVHIDDATDIEVGDDLDDDDLLAGADQLLADATTSPAQPLFRAGASVAPSAALPATQTATPA